jgi:LuxR family glucitol operon transcriptional activator
MASSVFAAPATYEAYIATTELGSSDLEDAITQLVELSLLDASDELLLVQRRYSVHPLTRSFARAQLRRRQDLEQQLQANSACFFHQYTITHGGEKWDWGSFDALEQEYANITNAVDWYFSQCDWQAIKDLRNALTLFLSIRGHWSKRVELAERTLRACQETGDKRLYAWCLVYDLAYIDLKYNSLDRAETRVKEGLKIFEDYKDELGVANATRHLGRIEHVRGNYELAETLYRKSHTLYVCQDTEYGAFLLWDLGDLHFTLKNYELAETYFQQTLEQSAGRKGKSEAVQAMASGYLGELAEMHGDIDKAQLYYSQELAIAQSIGRADEIALANKRMARLMAMARKDYASALRFAQAAYLVYYQLADYKTCADLKQMIQWLESPVDTRSDPPDAALLLDQREAS